MPDRGLSRRQFIAGSLAASVLAAKPGESMAEDRAQGSGFRLFWGDLHNHNAVGYGKGSLERSIELAHEHLDFFAFTGHASWHDMPTMPGDRHMKWVNGFEVTRNNWGKKPPSFSTIPAHSQKRSSICPGPIS